MVTQVYSSNLPIHITMKKAIISIVISISLVLGYFLFEPVFTLIQPGDNISEYTQANNQSSG